MSAGSELLIAILMAIGIMGTIIPLIPGIFLVWLAGALWAYFDGADGTRMWLLAVMTLFAVIGFAMQFVLPAKAATVDSPPKGTLLLGGLSGIIGFFLIPVIGAPLGFLGGVYASYFWNTGKTSQAWTSTIRTATAFGIALIVQFICALLIALTWIVGLIIT